MKQEHTTDLIRIAIPCYETRVMPRFGQAREFYFVTADTTTARILESKKYRSDHASPLHTIGWLKANHIECVLCGGIHNRFEEALTADGIRVYWGYIGEVEDVLIKWLNEDQYTRPQSSSFVCCCISRNSGQPIHYMSNSYKGVKKNENYHQLRGKHPGKQD
ncbi:MAG: NifB/NifX family molybdenum-iron cluster-binding protein [Desulfobacterales bacterium]|nr:NifB/NifX family molybdenum-iron cluster-binding protein [Desulfobacterales bacterium]MDD4072427.1 NifB/NifX family molybdenum-iron cluster-binding protein [Desulfobacterales bacterium]MDD4393808.1 NifB/NifX family molybdenum-iron cluster-binding protein [Desulfobacterales bacterium]